MRPEHWVYTIPLRLRSLFRRRQADQELDDELRDHVEARTEDYVAKGLPPPEAHRQALLEMDGIEKRKEECRDARRVNWIQELVQDLHFGVRMLRKSPGFTVVAVATLALGIGANTAIFSVVHGVLLAPLPYKQPDRLVVVWENNPRFPRVYVSYPNFRDWQRTARSFQEMAAFRDGGADLTAPGAPEHLDAKRISSGFFGTLGLNLALGRDFSPEEDRRGAAPVAIISDDLWRDRFMGRPDVLGKTVILDGGDYTIVGVAPPRFDLSTDADVYTPLNQLDPVVLDDRASHAGIFSVARLKSGVTVAESQAEMDTIQASLDHLYPEANRDLGVLLEPLKRVIFAGSSATLLILLGTVGLVLLIACANFANLLLVRSTARSREFAIRAALGASSARIIRQLITESVLLSLVGGALSVALAKWGVTLAGSAIPWSLPRNENVGVNGTVLLFALTVSIAVGIVFGLVPALKSRAVDPQSSLKEGGRGSSAAHHRAQSALVVLQMALTLVLLVGAGLLFRTIQRLWNVDPGFDASHLITFKVDVSPSQMKTPASARVAYQHLIGRIREIPGVQAADFTGTVPLTYSVGTMPFWINSQKPASLQGAPRVAMYLTGPDYLRTMKIPLLRGRFFTPQDTVKSPCVVVIDSVLARTFFPHSDPLKQTLSAGFEAFGPCRIVGVVGHVQDGEIGYSVWQHQPELYFPLYQDPDKWVLLNYPYTWIVVRTPLDLATVLPAIKSAVSDVGADQPVYNVLTMQQIVSDSMSSQRFPMILLGAFAGLALLLVTVGVYGVISYSVAQRIHEIGIRMALGAEKANIFRMMIGQGLRLALVGLSIGVVAALILTRVLSSFSELLYGLSENDPATFVAVSLVLIAVAILACYVPAYRATKVDPMVALKYE
jgi:predicted permease